MTTIPAHYEADHRREPNYRRVDVAGRHRDFVGGLWQTMGTHQLDFLLRNGLHPHHQLLDVGCGSLRAGRHLVDYLEPGNYYGLDVNRQAIQLGYDRELTANQRERLPVRNLLATDRFAAARFGVAFDMAIAQSVLTHMSLNATRLCFHRVAEAVRPGGRFYVTIFEADPADPPDTVMRGGTTFHERNAYWVYAADVEWLANGTGWDYRHLGDWGHPRGQQMIELTRRPA